MMDQEPDIGDEPLPPPTPEEERAEAWEYWHQRAIKFEAALCEITKLEPQPFTFPADWQQQIDACSECQRYKNHPIQQGICDEHRRPIYARERHDNHKQRTLIYRAKDIARAALTSGQREEI